MASIWRAERSMDETAGSKSDRNLQQGLIGYWPLRGDCHDRSGHGHHGINHGVDLASGTFNGRDSWIEVRSEPTARIDRLLATTRRLSRPFRTRSPRHQSWRRSGERNVQWTRQLDRSPIGTYSKD